MLSFEPSLVKYVYSTNLTADMMSLNHSVIGVDDDTFHTGIFLTYFSSHFYVHFGHGHAPGFARV